MITTVHLTLFHHDYHCVATTNNKYEASSREKGVEQAHDENSFKISKSISSKRLGANRGSSKSERKKMVKAWCIGEDQKINITRLIPTGFVHLAS